MTAVGGCGDRSTPKGHLRHAEIAVDGRRYTYAAYLPAGGTAGLPLLVVVHGCQTTADQQAAVSGYAPLADRRRFIVLYPDVDATGEARNRCWRAVVSPQSEGRGQGDAGAIAAMTRAAIARFGADPERVYAIGISAGGFETAILAAAYPDLYAAVGIHSGVAFRDVTCTSLGEPTDTVAALAGAALAEEGRRARVVPVLVLHGDADAIVPYACGRIALRQWLATDDLVLRHRGRPPLSSAPIVSRGTAAGGDLYTVASYLDASGCPVGRLITVQGMGHAWSGGTNDPSLVRYSDPHGPSAAAASWDFFARWRLSGPARRCLR